MKRNISHKKHKIFCIGFLFEGKNGFYSSELFILFIFGYHLDRVLYLSSATFTGLVYFHVGWQYAQREYS